jgi:hypothetical protein
MLLFFSSPLCSCFSVPFHLPQIKLFPRHLCFSVLIPSSLSLAFPFFFSLFFLSSIWPLFSILFSLLSSGFFFLSAARSSVFIGSRGDGHHTLSKCRAWWRRGFLAFFIKAAGACVRVRERESEREKKILKNILLCIILLNPTRGWPGQGTGSRVSWVNSGQPRKIKKKIKVLIFYMKKFI